MFHIFSTDPTVGPAILLGILLGTEIPLRNGLESVGLVGMRGRGMPDGYNADDQAESLIESSASMEFGEYFARHSNRHSTIRFETTV